MDKITAGNFLATDFPGKKEYDRWLGSNYVDDKTKAELTDIAERGGRDEIISRFAVPPVFGTAGLRQLMGAGISRLNVYTVKLVTKSLAKVIKDSGNAAEGVVIAYDSRNNSRLFAEKAAAVLAGEGIKAYLFESLRPTPELSFAVIFLGCAAGINITASHNPKEYNGYKVYWSDGAQVSTEHASKITDEMKNHDILNIKEENFDSAVKNGRIKIISDAVDGEYVSKVLDCGINNDALKKHGDSLELVYTPLHGAGHMLVPLVLARAGVSNLHVVPSQRNPDGNFPTVVSPNPENKECFYESEKYISANNLKTDVILATDPDGDRLGVAVKNGGGAFTPLTGNQIGAILIDYIIKARKTAGILPSNACAIRSVVSSELFDKICRANSVTPVTVLTGFKYIGEKINEYQSTGEHSFIFGYEESQGFLSGTYARDKDAVAASLLVSEAAAYYKSRGKTLFQSLSDIYSLYGRHDEITVSVDIKATLPMEAMAEKMEYLRKNPLSSLAGRTVTESGDFLSGEMLDISSGKTSKTGLPKTNMLLYKAKDISVIFRPSGTEPKVKAYIRAAGKDKTETLLLLDSIKKQVITLFAD